MLPLRHTLERLAPDELVVELDVAAVAEIPGREVEVLDRGGVEASADGGHAFVPRRREPLAIGLQARARVDGRERRRNPAGLDRVGRVRASSGAQEPLVL